MVTELAIICLRDKSGQFITAAKFILTLLRPWCFAPLFLNSTDLQVSDCLKTTVTFQVLSGPHAIWFIHYCLSCLLPDCLRV